MRQLARLVILIASAAGIAAASWPDAAFAQRGGRPPAGQPAPQGRTPAPAHRPHPINRGNVVFIGGYFYDPFFGPYPWWSRWSYPYFYYPEYYDNRAVVRIAGEPDKLADNASVYVDGFYAGIVEDFDGAFEGLPLSPGGHDIVLYMEGYRTVRQSVYLSSASTFKLRYAPERLPAGTRSEPPILAAPVPPPAEGTFIPPVTERPTPADAPRARATTGVAQGTLVLGVQPVDAEVRIDGERWASSDEGRFVVQLPAGTHRIEVLKSGFRTYSAEIRVAHDERSAVNVTLTPERP
jgi:hypothetical protein